MFTGIVEELGYVHAVVRQRDSVRLSVRGPEVVVGARPGDSIAVDGCCLTVAATDTEGFTADVMRETLTKTTLGALKAGSAVNLERAVTAGTRLGGHLVAGHVDGTGRILSRRASRHWDLVEVSVPSRICRFLVPKGSVAVDGISLTVVEVVDPPEPRFTVSLIPETLARTTLGRKQPGAAVNLEADIVAKYVERLLDQPAETTGQRWPRGRATKDSADHAEETT